VRHKTRQCKLLIRTALTAPIHIIIIIFGGAMTTVVLVEIGKKVFRWDFLVGCGEFLLALLIAAIVAIPGWLFWVFWHWVFDDSEGSHRVRILRGRRQESFEDIRNRHQARRQAKREHKVTRKK
jgi:hypothetical protein